MVPRRSGAVVDVSQNADFPTSRRVFINNSLIALSEIQPKDSGYRNKITVWIDGVGSHIKSDSSVDIIHMPAATFNSVKNALYNGTQDVDTRVLILHVGSSQVLECSRRMVIGQVLDVVAVAKALYPDLHLVISSVLPRPIDHDLTAKAVIEYNHAIKTAVNVASRRYLNVKYLSNHQLFTDELGRVTAGLFHKKQIRVSKKGASLLVQNFMKTLVCG